MDGDISEKIMEFLKDPEAAAKIASVAQSLTGSGKSTPEPNVPTSSLQPPTGDGRASMLSAVQGLTSPAGGDRRMALLAAIKPLLREDKRSKIDSLQKAMSIATVFGKLKGR